MRQKILIIEDEPAIADTITYALQTEGFEPIWCPTGLEGKAVFEQGGIILIIIDIGLPDISGFELCKEIRRVSEIPIIFLTARSEEIDRVVGLEIGADDYMVKPFSPRELTARVRAILRRTGSETSPQHIVDRAGDSPFTLEEHRKSITYFGTRLDLSRYEYRMLLNFIKHPGRVFSREELLDIVWEEPDTSLDRTVDTHIKTIRRKLTSIRPDYDPIETRRGFGYALKEYE
ncbi:two-component system response regulator CreB [candidate division CSSED10-310 bacterium]|uniref:Two-component system response regulator CreB n=1 Tax=candidate division CSSED10-310 bacterium TaxID=2855610 RepID=A0ABV6YYD2_UNCC1